MKIKLIHWNHQCADGCCDSYGVDIFLNDEKIGEVMDESDALGVVLKHLGHTDLEIERVYE